MHKPKSIFTKYVILTFLIALLFSFMHFNPKEHIALIRRKIFKEAYDYRRKKTEMEYREELGRSTWALLHIMAAKYSYSPTDIEKKDINDFIFLLAKVFPCIECKVHFSKMIQENPPQLDDHDSFVKWVCEIHNKVNVRLNKPVFDCRRHDERWDCGCNQ